MSQAAAIKLALSKIDSNRVSVSRLERLPYARDLAPVPDVLLKMLQIQPVPDAVVSVRSAEHVVEVLSQAYRERIVVTPRAGATTSLFAAVPSRGGILLDLTGLAGVMEIHEEEPSVTVLAGTTFAALDRHLRVKGFALRSYPSSAPAATIGGWLCSGGLGLGSLSYGPFHEQVVSAEFVQPDGRVLTLTRETIPSLRDLPDSEGTLGVVTSVKVLIRKRPEQEIVRLFAAQEIAGTKTLIRRLAEMRPYFVGFYDRKTILDLKRAGADSDLPANSDLVVAVFEGSDAEIPDVGAAASQAGATELSPGAAQQFWKDRFRILRLKRLGPGLMGSEALLPLKGFSAYAKATAEFRRRQGVRLSSHGYVVSPERVLTFSMFPTDERNLQSFVLDLSLVRKLYGLALNVGGRPYGLGLWNIPYRNHVFSPVERQKRRALKQHLDEHGIMNTGKVLDNSPFLSSALFPVSMEALAALRYIRRER